VTEQQIDRDHLRENATEGGAWGAVVLTLLDQLDLQERELDSWMARAYEAEGKLWKAEARIKAVEDVLDHPLRLIDWDDPLVPAEHIRRALEG